MMDKNAKIYVAGHRGMVGSAIVRELHRQGYMNITTRTHAELDLTRQEAVEKFFAEEKLQVRVSGQNGVGGDLTASRLVAEAGIQIGLIRRSENSHVEAEAKKERTGSR